jgi:hypothetical protein
MIHEERKLIRTADLKAMNVPTVVLRGSHATESSPGSGEETHASSSEVASRCPQGVVCLLSALSFYEIGTQSP